MISFASTDGLVKTEANTETYLGEQYRLERRDIWSPSRGRYMRVWCWEVLSGPGKGAYGGKQNLKADARKWARQSIKAWADEAALREKREA